MKKTIMIMIDGFGIPEKGWFDSVYAESCDRKFLELLAEFAMPVDATMGIPGIPQSATGQTALFTGFNTAEIMDGHIQGFPGPKLRHLISEQNLFSTLIKCGINVTFANAYVKHTLRELEKSKYRSVTTVMTDVSIGKVKDLDDLLGGEAVYHDLTRKSLKERYDVDEISPEHAAKDLINIARKYDFTLFEYFMTDRAGHKMDKELLAETLSDFSSFFCKLIDYSKDDIAVILTSDHGNCEDCTTKRHTLNPVPLFLYGLPSPAPGEINSIDQIYHLICSLA